MVMHYRPQRPDRSASVQPVAGSRRPHPSQMQLQQVLTAQLARRKVLHLRETARSDVTPLGAIIMLETQQNQLALHLPDRESQNDSRLAARMEGEDRREALARIGSPGPEAPLADVGHAALARADMLYEISRTMMEIGYRPDDGRLVGGTAYMSRVQGEAIHDRAMIEEIRGIAALEGRAGLQARAGIAPEAADALAERAGAKGLVDRHQADGGIEAEAHRDRLVRLRNEVGDRKFEEAMVSMRADVVSRLHAGDPADRDVATHRAAMRQMGRRADEDGLYSRTSRVYTNRLAVECGPNSEDGKILSGLTMVIDNQRHARLDRDDGAR